MVTTINNWDFNEFTLETPELHEVFNFHHSLPQENTKTIEEIFKTKTDDDLYFGILEFEKDRQLENYKWIPDLSYAGFHDIVLEVDGSEIFLDFDKQNMTTKTRVLKECSYNVQERQKIETKYENN